MGVNEVGNQIKTNFTEILMKLVIITNEEWHNIEEPFSRDIINWECQ